MAKNQLDKLFQSKLKNHEITPSPQAWEKLEFLLDEKAGQTTRRKGFLWISIAATVSLLLVSSLIIWQYNQGGKTNDMANSVKSENKLKNDQSDNSSEKVNEFAQKDNNQSKIEQEKSEEMANNKNKNNSQSTDNQGDNSERKNENQLVKLPKNQQKNKTNDLNKNNNQNNRTEKLDNQLINENKQETEIAQNNPNNNPEGKSYTIKVTTKINSLNASKTSEPVLAENTDKRKGVRGVLKNIRDIKNGDKELKLFGTEADKVLASIGKE
jgi:FtsZ-interacting cell division protein ZipA